MPPALQGKTQRVIGSWKGMSAFSIKYQVVTMVW